MKLLRPQRPAWPRHPLRVHGRQPPLRAGLPGAARRPGNDLTLVLEIKGYEDDQTKAKHDAARRWVSAVNNWGKLGPWAFHVCRNPQTLGKELEYLAARTLPIRAVMDGIRKYWGNTPAGSAAQAIIQHIAERKSGDRLSLSLSDVSRMLDQQEISKEVIAALAILTKSEFAIFLTVGEFFDEEGVRHPTFVGSVSASY